MAMHGGHVETTLSKTDGFGKLQNCDDYLDRLNIYRMKLPATPDGSSLGTVCVTGKISQSFPQKKGNRGTSSHKRWTGCSVLQWIEHGEHGATVLMW